MHKHITTLGIFILLLSPSWAQQSINTFKLTENWDATLQAWVPAERYSRHFDEFNRLLGTENERFFRGKWYTTSPERIGNIGSTFKKRLIRRNEFGDKTYEEYRQILILENGDTTSYIHWQIDKAFTYNSNDDLLKEEVTYQDLRPDGGEPDLYEINYEYDANGCLAGSVRANVERKSYVNNDQCQPLTYTFFDWDNNEFLPKERIDYTYEGEALSRQEEWLYNAELEEWVPEFKREYYISGDTSIFEFYTWSDSANDWYSRFNHRIGYKDIPGRGRTNVLSISQNPILPTYRVESSTYSEKGDLLRYADVSYNSDTEDSTVYRSQAYTKDEKGRTIARLEQYYDSDVDTFVLVITGPLTTLDIPGKT